MGLQGFVEVYGNAGEPAQGDQPGAEEGSPDRVAFDSLLLQHRLVVLGVGAVALPAFVVATILNPELGKLKVALLLHRHRHLGLQIRFFPEQ